MFPLLDFYVEYFFAENFQWGSSGLERQTKKIKLIAKNNLVSSDGWDLT